jgi:hypothetical protein
MVEESFVVGGTALVTVRTAEGGEDRAHIGRLELCVEGDDILTVVATVAGVRKDSSSEARHTVWRRAAGEWWRSGWRRGRRRRRRRRRRRSATDRSSTWTGTDSETSVHWRHARSTDTCRGARDVSG